MKNTEILTAQKMIRVHTILMRGKNNVLDKKKTVFWKKKITGNERSIYDTCEYTINERKKQYFG